MFYLLMQDYGVSVENIFPVEPSACPPLVEIKKLPNKVVLWCGKISVLINSYILFSLRLLTGLFTLFLLGTRSSNMLRHLQKGFLPSVCSLPVPGYMVILIVYNFSASIF
jgi:poly [ADP-ribose] polymerase